MQHLIIEKHNDVYNVYILLETKHFYVNPLYEGADIEKAKETVNNYYNKHIEDIEQSRKRDLNFLEKLI